MSSPLAPRIPTSATRAAWALLVVVCLVGSAAHGRTPRAPQAAAAAPAAAGSPLLAARACAARADSACVVRLLSAAKPTAAQAAEHWLSLAFAASRTGKHAQAQTAFATWLALDPGHRLDRGQVPARVWPDYVAALLKHHGGDLDLRPRVAREAQVPPATGSWRDLPITPPPPRSSRDRARDAELLLAGGAGARLPGGFASGLELAVRLRMSPTLQLGLGVLGVAMPPAPAPPAGASIGDGASATAPSPGERGLLGVAIGVDATWALLQRSWGRVAVGGLVGGGMLEGPTAVVAPAVRLTWLRAGAAWGLEAGLSDRVWLGGGAAIHTVMVSLGVLLRPGGSRPQHRQGPEKSVKKFESVPSPGAEANAR